MCAENDSCQYICVRFVRVTERACIVCVCSCVAAICLSFVVSVFIACACYCVAVIYLSFVFSVCIVCVFYCLYLCISLILLTHYSN